MLFHSEGDLVTFSAGSSTSYPDELVAYHWDWDGDGEVDETTQDENGKHIFNSPGRYEVILTVEDDDKSTDSTSVFVTITDVGPVARLEAVATPEGDPVLLDASGTEEPGSDFVAFRWDLDGDMVWDVEDTCSTLVRTWDEPGMYSITMQVEDEDGSKASKGITLVIQDVAPVADTGGPYEVFEGTPLLLDASGSHEPGRDFTLFRWDLDGDGAFDEEGMELEWTFTLSGEYTISLRVEDEDGSSGEATTTLVVLDKDPEFTIDLPDNVMENVPANFSLVDLYDPGTEVFQVTWHFGDGETANGPTVEHAFPEQGTYRGRVVVEDNDGTVVTVPWPRELPVANSPPVVELSTLVLKATEDSQFTISVFGHDTANDTVTYDFKGPGGKIDEQTGVFKWTPLDEHVGKNKFTFIAVDEDGGEGVLEVEIDVKDVDNDFPGGLPFATGMAIVIVIILAAVGAFIIVGRQRKKAEAEVIEAEDKVDLKAQVEVDLDEAAAPEAAPELEDVPPVAPAVTEAPPAKPPRKRPPEGRPPPKKRPPGAPPPKKRPPGQRPPPKKRPPGAPPPKKRPPGQRPPPKKRPPGAPPPKKRPPGAPPRKRHDPRERLRRRSDPRAHPRGRSVPQELHPPRGGPHRVSAHHRRRRRDHRHLDARSNGGHERLPEPGGAHLQRRWPGKSAGHDVGHPHGLGQVPSQRGDPEQLAGLVDADARNVAGEDASVGKVHPVGLWRRDKAVPLLPVGEPALQRLTDRVVVGDLVHHGDHRDPRLAKERLDVDHVEARQSEPVQEDGLQLRQLPAALDQAGHRRGGVQSIEGYGGGVHRLQVALAPHDQTHQERRLVTELEGAVIDGHHSDVLLHGLASSEEAQVARQGVHVLGRGGPDAQAGGGSRRDLG
ncbi:MAG: PKD domain-containing protein [Thermoplasmata archaeon]|nr:PKD domain-containing protein [Thermoplasmata archaeon]